MKIEREFPMNQLNIFAQVQIPRQLMTFFIRRYINILHAS